MKLSKRNMLLVSFMLFSLFFGAGNLIFPPFLGHSAGSVTLTAGAGFVLTAVVLPVMGVAVVAKWGSLNTLCSKVHPVFAVVYTTAIYLALGPGLAIPRAASVPFEMAVAPYLPQDFSGWVGMLLYSLVFFALSLWLSLTPSKLVKRLGSILTPVLLALLVALFAGFCLGSPKQTNAPQPDYAGHPFVKGFCEGYLTMDTLAGLIFGVVIVSTLEGMGFRDKKQTLRYTSICGIFAGAILAVIYIMLMYMGMQSAGVYPLGANGVATLRAIVEQIFGLPGAVLLAAIFTLACLTTCVGLITSVAEYFAALTKKSYRLMVYLVTGFSFLVCNQGLNVILSVSVPVLNAVYPVAILLILLGLSDALWQKNPFVYPITIGLVGVVSLIHALDGIRLVIPVITPIFRLLPLYDQGFGWLTMAFAGLILSLILGIFKKSEETV